MVKKKKKFTCVLTNLKKNSVINVHQCNFTKKNCIYKNYFKIQQQNGRKVLAMIKFPEKVLKKL